MAASLRALSIGTTTKKISEGGMLLCTVLAIVVGSDLSPR